MAAINVDIQSKSSCPDASLKIFREDPAEITQSAGEDQDVGISAAPNLKSRLWKIIGRGNQDTSTLPGLQLRPISAASVEDDYAIAKKAVEETPKPNEPSEWVSLLINGVHTVESMVGAIMDVSRFLEFDF